MSGKPGTCSRCHGTTGSRAAKLCQTCYYSRGPTGGVVQKPPCEVCGKTVARRDNKRCRECYEAGARPKGRLPQSYEEALAVWRQVIGCAQQQYSGPAKARASTTQRIAVVSDFHAPFQHDAAFAAFIEREKGADLCIVGGDLQDNYSISRFTKYEAVTMQAELAAAQHILERLSETFPHVLVVAGNHDAPRLEKLLYEKLPPEAVEAIRYLSGGTLSTVEALCRQFPNVEVSKQKAGRFSLSWFAQVGDLIVSHAEKFSRVPGSALRSVEDWFSDFDDTLGLQPWRVIVQAHTHQLGWFPFRGDRLLVESGCLCAAHGYQFVAKVGGRPQRQGWVTLEQHDGVTDLESVRPVWWRG